MIGGGWQPFTCFCGVVELKFVHTVITFYLVMREPPLVTPPSARMLPHHLHYLHEAPGGRGAIQPPSPRPSDNGCCLTYFIFMSSRGRGAIRPPQHHRPTVPIRTNSDKTTDNTPTRPVVWGLAANWKPHPTSITYVPLIRTPGPTITDHPPPFFLVDIFNNLDSPCPWRWSKPRGLLKT